MKVVFWSIEFLATLFELILSLIFCGIFIKDTNLKQSILKKIIISNIATILMILVNQIELYSYMTVVAAFIITFGMLIIIYPKNKIKIFVLCALLFLILNVIDNIVAYTVSYIAKIKISEIFQKMSIYRVFAIITSKTLLVLQL